MHAGFERDMVVEAIAKTKIDMASRPLETQDPYRQLLLELDSSRRACTMLTQDLNMPLFVYTPQHRDFYKLPAQKLQDLFGSLLMGKHEVISIIGESLKFP